MVIAVTALPAPVVVTVCTQLAKLWWAVKNVLPLVNVITVSFLVTAVTALPVPVTDILVAPLSSILVILLCYL